MSAIIQGSKQDPTRVDVQKTDDQWVLGVDLANLPEGTTIKAVRRVFNLQKDHVYVYRSEFIDRSTGSTKEVISRATVATDDIEANQQNTVGLVDSPLSVELWDIT